MDSRTAVMGSAKRSRKMGKACRPPKHALSSCHAMLWHVMSCAVMLLRSLLASLAGSCVKAEETFTADVL